MEKEPKVEREQSIINRQEIKGFIKNRNINPEDFHLIEKLAAFPREMIIMELHNIFNVYHDRSGQELETLIKISKDEEKRQLYESALNFYHKYGWAVSWNLVRLLEEI